MKMNNFQNLADKWPSAWVERNQLGKFSGGLIHPRTMRNYDSQGIGISEKVRIGRKVAYPVQAVITWLERRADNDTNQKKGL